MWQLCPVETTSMRIKKHSKNEYVLGGGLWVRNFHKQNVPYLSINRLYGPEDQSTCVRNEIKNKTLNLANISDEKLVASKVVIVSDGYDFEKRHLFLAKLPKDVVILAVNGALKKWKLMSGDVRRPISSYVVNNPYHECVGYLPNDNYWPTCIASVRTNESFMKSYKGQKYLYWPTPEEDFGFRLTGQYSIDDYRNPVCAAIGLAYRFGVKKLMLVCCDDSFADKRDAAVQLENGLWAYPQHLRCQQIIDANLMWLLKQDEDIVVSDYSLGPKQTNASYIYDERAAMTFFNEGDEE